MRQRVDMLTVHYKRISLGLINCDSHPLQENIHWISSVSPNGTLRRIDMSMIFMLLAVL